MSLQNRVLRKRIKSDMLAIWEQCVHYAREDGWAENAQHSATVGDSAKVRTVAARPTEAIALHGYPPGSEDPATKVDPDTMARGKAALRRQREKSQKAVLDAAVRFSNVVDGEARKLEKAMGYLRPGPSARNPQFEVPVKGDMKLPGDVIRELEQAQARRSERGEGLGG